ncbi:hypothetical protein QYF36_013744 [Acer negundo]|nr:hypothetical protein QYF36_013744 [Acer negundo]
MNRVRIVISYNGRWEQLPDGSQRFVGSDNQEMYMSKNMTYEELMAIVHTIMKYDVNKFNVNLTSISIVPGSTCRTFIRNNDDVQFMLGEDQVIPQVDDLENVDEEPTQIQTQGRHVQGVNCTVPNMTGTFEVRHNITVSDSDNTITWVIPGADSYLFGIGRSSTLATQEPTSMIYKGQFFPSKKDLKRLQQHVGRLMRPKDIIADMKTMYGIQVMYSKAHDALQYALSLTYGTHEESLKLLPSFAYVLEQQNPSTITDLQCADDDTFLYFFISLGSLIKGFQRCMRLVIAVDDTHLKGRFRGTMFIATAQDGNERVYPIAFGYGDSENNLSLEWFLECLRGSLGHIDDQVFISDRHASIEAGISKVFPYATHTICFWHFDKNMKKRFHRKDVADIMDSAARTYNEFNYNRHMNELRRLHKGAFDYAIAASPNKWFRVHCP